MAPQKIAIVGSGCAGIGAAWSLHGRGRTVHLYESDSRLGGHVNSVPFTKGHLVASVDTGFVAFNRETYPCFTHLIDSLGLATREVDMSISFEDPHKAFKWAGTGLVGLFAQWTNMISPSFWRMLFDVLRFNYFACDILKNSSVSGSPSKSPESGLECLSDYLERNAYSREFCDHYLVPIVASTWCTAPDLFADSCSAEMLIRFMWNHHLLEPFSNPLRWFTFPYGASGYVEAVLKRFPPSKVILETPVKSVQPLPNGQVRLTTQAGATELYDHVVLATSASCAATILGESASSTHRAVLSSFQTTSNECVLHSDTSLMPSGEAAHASWNYVTPGPGGPVPVTFSMNRLQGHSASAFGPILVSMNPQTEPDSRTVQGRWTYAHPLYSVAAVQAQADLPLIQGVDNISFAGAWTRFGFHEDGLASGIDAAVRFCGGKSVPGVATGVAYSRKGSPRLTVGDMLARTVLAIGQYLITLRYR